MKIANGSFPMDWDEEKHKLTIGGSTIASSVRKLSDMVPVLYDKAFAKSADLDCIYYYMHRGVKKAEDAGKFSQYRRRYDVTVVPPATLGKEFVKTIGHYHELSPAKGHFSFPELYEVLSGTAHFLLFKRKFEAGKDIDDRIDDAILLEAKAGEKAFMPPNYGHIMINPSEETLVTCNLVEWKFKSIYEPVAKLGGGPYFELANGSVEKNSNYAQVPAIRRVDAADYGPTLSLGLTQSPAYDSFVKDPSKFGFLEP